MEDKIKKNIPLLIFLAIMLMPVFKNSPGLLIVIVVIILIFYIKKHNKLNLNKSMDNVIDMDNLKTNKNIKKNVLVGVGSVLIIWLFFASIIVVDAGETGVYSLFGRVKDQELRSGFHLVIPLAKVTKMTIRTEEYTMSIISDEGNKKGADAITALTKEGLSVDLDMTVLYRLNEEQASDIYKNVGLTYDEKIIRPSIRSVIREVIAKYEAKDIYSEKRQDATIQIQDSLREDLEPRGIVIEEVLLRNVVLPSNLANSIQEKLQAEQEAEKYDFLLTKEEKEKQRKVIEAEGQRDAQSIINQSLSQNYLYYLYIRELKDREGTIYIPTSPSTGLPLFRNLGN